MSEAVTTLPLAPTEGARRGSPRKPKIVTFRPTIQRSHMHAVLECMVADQVGATDRAGVLTAALSELFGVAGGCALSDQAAGIAAAYTAAGLVPGGRLLMSALAPAIYVQTAEQRGIVPILADVDPNTGGMRLDELQRLLELPPQAILLTHASGGRDDPELVSGLDIPVIEDVSGRWRDTVGETSVFATASDHHPAGENTETDAAAFGDVLLVSLAERSMITAGGGIVVLGRNRRLQRAITAVTQTQAASSLPDINTALAMAQLQDLAVFVRLRSRQAEMFAAALSPTRHKTYGSTASAAPVAFPVVVQAGMKEVRRYASKHGIQTTPAYSGCALECYQQPGDPDAEEATETDFSSAGRLPQELRDLPEVLRRQLTGAQREQQSSWPAARALTRQCLLFPLYPSLPEEAVQRVAKVLATLP